MVHEPLEVFDWLQSQWILKKTLIGPSSAIFFLIISLVYRLSHAHFARSVELFAEGDDSRRNLRISQFALFFTACDTHAEQSLVRATPFEACHWSLIMCTCS